MTDDATNSTSDATLGDDHPAGETVLAALVRGNLDAAVAFGFDAGALAAAANLKSADLEDPDGRVPFERYLALWEAICALPDALRFALWLGKAVRIEMLGVVGYVMQNAGDVRSALRCFERFNMLLGDHVGPRITEDADTVVLHRTEPPRVTRLAPFSMAAPLGTVTLLRQLARISEAEPLAIEAAFQNPPIERGVLAEYEAALGCSVRFNARDTRLVLSRAVLDRSLTVPNPGLFAYLENHASLLQAKLRGSTSLAGRVRQLLAERIREGEPEQRSIAKKLALSERTLQRRLQEENVTFADLVDEVRADLARMYLNDETLAVFEVAFLLGYSEPSAFNRAFRRWTGQSPSQYRQRRDDRSPG